jgi:hypothetical protein
LYKLKYHNESIFFHFCALFEKEKKYFLYLFSAEDMYLMHTSPQSKSPTSQIIFMIIVLVLVLKYINKATGCHFFLVKFRGDKNSPFSLLLFISPHLICIMQKISVAEVLRIYS